MPPARPSPGYQTPIKAEDNACNTSISVTNDEDSPEALVQLGCAMVGVVRKDLAQHLKKLDARARINKLRYDHFFTGSGVPLCEKDLHISLQHEEVEVVEWGLYTLLTQHGVPVDEKAQNLDGQRLQLVKTGIRLHGHIKALATILSERKAGPEGPGDALELDYKACQQLESMMLLLDQGNFMATPLLMLVSLKFGQINNILLQLLLATNLEQLMLKGQLVLAALQLIRRVARKGDACSLLVEPVALGNDVLSVATLLHAAASQAVAKLALLQAVQARSERELLMMKLANTVIETYKVLKGSCTRHLSLAPSILPPIPGLDAAARSIPSSPASSPDHTQGPVCLRQCSGQVASSAAATGAAGSHPLASLHSHPFFNQAAPEQKQAGSRHAQSAKAEACQHPYFRAGDEQPGPGRSDTQQAQLASELDPAVGSSTMHVSSSTMNVSSSTMHVSKQRNKQAAPSSEPSKQMSTISAPGSSASGRASPDLGHGTKEPAGGSGCQAAARSPDHKPAAIASASRRAPESSASSSSAAVSRRSPTASRPSQGMEPAPKDKTLAMVQSGSTSNDSNDSSGSSKGGNRSRQSLSPGVRRKSTSPADRRPEAASGSHHSSSKVSSEAHVNLQKQSSRSIQGHASHSKRSCSPGASAKQAGPAGTSSRPAAPGVEQPTAAARGVAALQQDSTGDNSPVSRALAATVASNLLLDTDTESEASITSCQALPAAAGAARGGTGLLAAGCAGAPGRRSPCPGGSARQPSAAATRSVTGRLVGALREQPRPPGKAAADTARGAGPPGSLAAARQEVHRLTVTAPQQPVMVLEHKLQQLQLHEGSSPKQGPSWCQAGDEMVPGLAIDHATGSSQDLDNFTIDSVIDEVARPFNGHCQEQEQVQAVQRQMQQMQIQHSQPPPPAGSPGAPPQRMQQGQQPSPRQQPVVQQPVRQQSMMQQPMMQQPVRQQSMMQQPMMQQPMMQQSMMQQPMMQQPMMQQSMRQQPMMQQAGCQPMQQPMMHQAAQQQQPVMMPAPMCMPPAQMQQHMQPGPNTQPMMVQPIMVPSQQPGAPPVVVLQPVHMLPQQQHAVHLPMASAPPQPQLSLVQHPPAAQHFIQAAFTARHSPSSPATSASEHLLRSPRAPRPIVIPSSNADDPYLQSWGTPTSSAAASPMVRTPADERRQMSSQLVRNLRASVEAEAAPASPAAGAAGGYWGSPLNSGRAEGGISPLARTPAEAAAATRTGGSQLQRNTRAAELQELSEGSTWGSPETNGGSPTPGSCTRQGQGSAASVDAAFATPSHNVSSIDPDNELLPGSAVVQPRSMLAAALDQATSTTARRALDFDNGPEAPAPAPAPAPGAASAPGLGAAQLATPSPMNSATQRRDGQGLVLPPAALQAVAAAAAEPGSPAAASPHHDQRNTRDQVGPSSNTRRRSQTNIPAAPAVPANAEPRAAVSEQAYLDTWGSPRSDDISVLEATPALHSMKHLIPGSGTSSGASSGQVPSRGSRLVPGASASPLSKMTLHGSDGSPGQGQGQQRMSQPGEEVPLVGQVKPLDEFISMYRTHSPGVAARLAAASADFSRMRPVSGDGNCFYRALIFALLEHVVTGPNLQLHQRLILRLEQLWLQLWQMLTPQETTIAGRDALMGLLRRMWFLEPANGLDLSGVEQQLQERQVFDPIVQFLRMLTSFELQNNAELYAPFLAGCYGDMDMLQICATCVEPMGQDAEQLQMVALARALDVCVGVLDVAGSEVTYIKHPSGAAAPAAWLLHTPGHYSIVYPREAFNVRRGHLCAS